ncbi:MAG: T9SS type A sorting domain-containing protein, partial [Bacteroidota bacterium]
FVLGDSAIANASIGFIKKYDLNGVLMWSRNISTAYPYLFIARDNVLSVLLENKPGADTLYLYKYAMINGDSLFSKAIIANHLPDTAISLVDFSIGLYDSYYICYNQQPSHSASGYFYNFKIVKSDFLGNIEWQKYFVDTVNFTQANAATSTSDSGYAILRTQNNSCTPYSPKCILLKLNGDGDSISQTCFGNPFYLNSRFSDIIETSSNLLASIAYGDSDIMYFNSLDHFISVIVCDSLGNYPSWLIEEDPINNAYIFPNPFTDYIKINYPISVNQATKIDLYDSIGRNLLTKIIEENNQSIDLSFIDNGFYLLTIHYQDRIRSLKIVKVVR